MKVYKIKHIPTGLYWKGGGIPNYMSYLLTSFSGEELVNEIIDMKFNSKGKTWNQIGHAKAAITYQQDDKFMRDILKDCELQEFTLNLNTNE